MKNVQIPYDLFVALMEYLLAYDDCAEEIRQGLEQKLDALVRYELYVKYKTASTAEEREQERITLLFLSSKEKEKRLVQRYLQNTQPQNEILCSNVLGALPSTSRRKEM